MTSKNAFTLLEVLIISAIIALFSGSMLATYNNFTQQKNLDREISKLVDVLSLAKSKAQSADTYFACSGSDEFGGYNVEINENDYNFKQCCRDVTTKSQTACGNIVQTYDLPPLIRNTSGLLSVNFYPLSEGATPANFELRSDTINKCSTISILANGLITTSDLLPC